MKYLKTYESFIGKSKTDDEFIKRVIDKIENDPTNDHVDPWLPFITYKDIKGRFREQEPEIKLESSYIGRDEEFVKKIIPEIEKDFDPTQLRREEAGQLYVNRQVKFTYMHYNYTIILLANFDRNTRLSLRIDGESFDVSKKTLRKLFDVLDHGKIEYVKKTIKAKEAEPDVEL